MQSNVITDECKEECPSYIYETKSGVYIYCNKIVGSYANSWHVYISKSAYITTSGLIDLENKEIENFVKLLESYK
jgi:hypothetical protein